MKIIKYKKLKGSKYQIILDNNAPFVLHEKTIIDNDLLIKKEVEDILKLQEDDKKYDILDDAIKYLEHHVRCLSEMESYLQKKGYSEADINNCLTYLLKNKYLDDKIYSQSYVIDKINFSLDGPLKIIKYFEKMQIAKEDYSDALKLFNDDILNEKITKVINKAVRLNKVSKAMLKQKVVNNLINLGYDYDLINSRIDMIDSVNDEDNFIKKKEQITKKLSSKYSGYELERKVKEKLYRLGYFK